MDREQGEVIWYAITLEDGGTVSFEVDPDRAERSASADSRLPEWTRLEVHRCQNCSLEPDGALRCPPAADTAEIIERFADVSSIDVVDVVVSTPAREIRKKTDVQTALRSLLGLVMATSGCPHLSQLRVMAKHHLPFASTSETLFRSVSTFLLKQYFVSRRGGRPDLDLTGLRQLYEDLQQVNDDFCMRIREAVEKDANLNAVVLLSATSILVAGSLDEGLEGLESMFSE
jgi:hypothetical protein